MADHGSYDAAAGWKCPIAHQQQVARGARVAGVCSGPRAASSFRPRANCFTALQASCRVVKRSRRYCGQDSLVILRYGAGQFRHACLPESSAFHAANPEIELADAVRPVLRPPSADDVACARHHGRRMHARLLQIGLSVVGSADISATAAADAGRTAGYDRLTNAMSAKHVAVREARQHHEIGSIRTSTVTASGCANASCAGWQGLPPDYIGGRPGKSSWSAAAAIRAAAARRYGIYLQPPLSAKVRLCSQRRAVSDYARPQRQQQAPAELV